ncbi:hypothetical protein BDN71DRAFT_936755 [Pleurotus eryngii]|uniref:Uncharacterized protein n=1 Tax=Pleurotus eryngii TaxID=5323 RepID=A0A9P5ZW50_PLEER|nr:hypothetical protein BDN71DRAFT_936755 [Pleurotus eryngii]
MICMTFPYANCMIGRSVVFKINGWFLGEYKLRMQCQCGGDAIRTTASVNLKYKISFEFPLTIWDGSPYHAPQVAPMIPLYFTPLLKTTQPQQFCRVLKSPSNSRLLQCGGGRNDGGETEEMDGEGRKERCDGRWMAGSSLCMRHRGRATALLLSPTWRAYCLSSLM